jgi:hypothetical protein
MRAEEARGQARREAARRGGAARGQDEASRPARSQAGAATGADPRHDEASGAATGAEVRPARRWARRSGRRGDGLGGQRQRQRRAQAAEALLHAHACLRSCMHTHGGAPACTRMVELACACRRCRVTAAVRPRAHRCCACSRRSWLETRSSSPTRSRPSPGSGLPARHLLLSESGA